jgi:hypothetical protein
MDSDEVNSVSDTVESRQVGNIIKTAYYNIISRANLTEHNRTFQLTATDTSTPVLMLRPDSVNRVNWIKYDKSDDSDPNYEYVTVLPLEQFLDYVNALDPDEDNVGELTLNDITYRYRNDQQPTYCTVIQDYYIIFDSYDEDEDNFLQESKTLCFGLIVPTFSMSDSFVPDLDDQMFPLLLNEAKSLAFLEMKQTSHDKAEQESRRQWRSLQRNKELIKPTALDQFANFGRRR